MIEDGSAARVLALPDTTGAWQEELRGVAAAIDEFVASSEGEFVDFAARLQECLAQANALSGTARRAVEAVSGEAVGECLTRFREQTRVLEEHSRSGSELVEKMDRRLGETLASLRRIPAFDQEFRRSVKTLRALGVATHVESARLGEKGEGFMTLALDVQKLAEQVGEKFALVLAGSRGLEKEMAAALETVLGAQVAMHSELQQTLAGLATGTQELAEVNRQVQAGAERVGVRSADLSDRIGAVVASLQFQDITRQRLEHVRDSLALLAEELERSEEEEGTEDRTPALAAMVARLQSSQLRDAEGEFFGAAAGILDDIPALAGNVADLGRDVRGITVAGGASNASFLQELNQGLVAVVTGVHRGAEQNEEISRLLTASAQTAGEITAFIEDIDEIGSDIELIAINAIVQSSRTGAEGRPLAVIAQAIQRQSVDARQITGRVSALLGEIGEAARELETLAEAFKATAQEEAGQVARDLEELLGGFEAADGRYRDCLATLEKESQGLGAELSQLAPSMTLHLRLRDLAGTSCPVLERIQAEAEAQGGGADPDGNRELLDGLASQYTMESQRAIHRMLEESVPVVGDSGSLGSNVELF